MQLPTIAEIEMLHKKYASSPAAFATVFTHCQIVGAIAEQLIAKGSFVVDVELVKAACLLHDIGVYPLLDAAGKEKDPSQYITHGILGEHILQTEQLPQRLWRFASHHTGLGLTKQNIQDQHLSLPAADYTAETAEERLVMYADKFHSKFAPYFNSFEWYKTESAKFGADKPATFEKLAAEFGIPNLEPLIKKYGHGLRA